MLKPDHHLCESENRSEKEVGMDDKHRKVFNLKMGYEKKKKGNLEKSHAVFQSGQREHYQIWEGRQTKEQADRQGGREEEGKRAGCGVQCGNPSSSPK